MLADSRGLLVKPARGALELGWLFQVSAESVRQARERLVAGPVHLDQETLVGWFCLGAPTDRTALEELEGKAWRKALRIWKARADDRVALHNRATLHRLLYLSPGVDNPGGHIRKAYELYHRLHQEVPGRYGIYVEWVDFELERAIYKADGDSEDDMVARSLRLVAETRGLTCCEEIQEDLMLDAIDDLAIHCATVVRELLPYQGVTSAPPKGLLDQLINETELELLPPAVRLAYRLVPETRQRRRVDALVAELCGLLSLSLYKAGDGRRGKKWQTEAGRWEAHVAAEWSEPEPGQLGDEDAAEVAFTEAPEELPEAGPRRWGPAWLGLHARPTRIVADDPREEWLEAFRFLGLPLFPVRRLVCYRNFENQEIGRVERLELTTFHHLWQAAAVVGLTFVLILGVTRARVENGAQAPAKAAPAALTAQQSEKALERLKYLAQLEAKLRKAEKRDTERLEAIAVERKALIEKLEQQEKSR